MKASRAQLRQMSAAFSYLATLDVMPKFAMSLHKNQNALKGEVLALQEVEKRLNKNPKWVDYSNKRNNILRQFGIKEKDGSIRTVNGMVAFPSEHHSQLATHAIADLQRNYPEEVEYEKIFETNLKSILDEEVDITFTPLKNDDIKSPVVLEKLQSVMNLLE